jgi:opacity protein-like surface antigen
MKMKLLVAALAITLATPAVAQRSWHGGGGGHGGHHGWGHHGWSHRGLGPALGVGLGVASALASSPYAYGPGYVEEGVDRDDGYCSARFRSYDPASGTYLAYDGQRHSCP